jgi:hypothetical protein
MNTDKKRNFPLIGVYLRSAVVSFLFLRPTRAGSGIEGHPNVRFFARIPYEF